MGTQLTPPLGHDDAIRTTHDLMQAVLDYLDDESRARCSIAYNRVAGSRGWLRARAAWYVAHTRDYVRSLPNTAVLPHGAATADNT